MGEKKWLLIFSGLLWFAFALAILLHMGIDAKDATKTTIDSKLKVYKTEEMMDVAEIHNNYQDEFEYYDQTEYAGSLSDGFFWFSITRDVITESYLLEDSLYFEISKPQLDSFTYYAVSMDGDIINTKAYGRSLDFDSRDIAHRYYYVPIDQIENVDTMYFMVETDSYLQFPTNVLSEMELIDFTTKDMLQNGIFYGAMLIMLLFNGILGLTIRDRRYIFFAAFIFANTLLQAVWDGFTFQYIWSTNGMIDLFANPFSINLTAITLLLFSRSIFNIAGKKAIYDFSFSSVLIFQIFCLLMVPFLPYSASVYLAMFNALLTVIVLVFIFVDKRIITKAEVTYLLAWEFFFAANLLSVAAGLKWIQYSQFIQMSPRIAVLGLTALFSLALTDKINTIEFQKHLEAEQRRLLRNLHDMHVKVSSSSNLEEGLKYLFEMFTRVFDFKQCVLVVMNDWDYHCEVYSNMENSGYCLPLSSEKYEQLSMQINKNSNEVAEDKDFMDAILGLTLPYHLTLPLINNGKAVGVIILYATKPVELKSTTQTMLRDYAKQIAITIDNKKLMERISFEAKYDALTNIYNRRYFFELALKDYKRAETALLIIDIDDFKNINDTYGHLVGDKVLVGAVNRLADVVKGKGYLGRYGGEEFVVYFIDKSKDEVYEMADQILSAFNRGTEEIIWQGSRQLINITVSVGMAFKEGTESVHDMMDHADKALYFAKGAGKNRKSVYQ